MTTQDRLAGVVRAALAPSGFLLEDVTITPAGRRRVVRVVVDRDLGDVADAPSAPLSMDDVAAATRLVNGALDDSDILGAGPYILEVTSPGVSRPLTAPRHFARNVGRLVTLTRAAGAEPITGRIVRVDEHGVLVEEGPDAAPVPVPFADLRRGQVHVEFNRGEPISDNDSEED